MKVKRYELEVDFDDEFAELHEDEHGCWVDFTDYESLQAQLKRERALCDKLIEATEKDRCSHSIDPIYDRNVRDAIAAIHSEREKS